MKKIKASSLSTEDCKNKAISKTEKVKDILESQDLEYDPKKDSELLSLGIRSEGGPQISSRKARERFKPGELDLGRYMSTGLNIVIGKKG